jgi:NADH dehydrogenase FAD-containing subunit
MSGSKNKVVILGGGFGGLYAAIKTSKNFPQLDITLVDNKVI